MAAASEQQVVALELEKVLPKVRTLFEVDDTFYASIKKRNVEKISSRQMRIPLKLRPGGSFQYFDPNGGDLGRGGAATWDKAVVQSVFVSQNTEYTKLTQWSTDDKSKSITNAVREFVADALDEIKRQLDSQLMQSGTGQIGIIDAVTAGAGFDTYDLDNVVGSRLMRYGQTVQIYDAGLGTLRGMGVISFHDTSNHQIQVTPNIAGVVATDVIVTAGISSPASLPAIYGVPYHHSNASTGTWLGFSRATTPEIRANRVNAAGAAFSLPLPRLLVNQIGNRLGKNKSINAKAWMHPAQMAAYEDLGMSMTFIQKSGSKPNSLDLYYDKMTMAGISTETSFSWPKDRIDFIAEEVWGRGETLPIGFYKTDGRHIFEIRGPSGGVATADIFYMVWGGQFFVNNPAACAYIDNLAIPTGY